MPLDKAAVTDHPVHDLIRDRWSPRAFADRPVPRDVLCSLLEAARWAPSRGNAQPWAYILATTEQEGEFERILGCYSERNQAWAFAAPVIMIGCAKQTMPDGAPNLPARHDLGAASAFICLQATALGLKVHQMVGLDVDKVRATYAVPEDYDILTGVALGYQGDPDALPETFDLRARELLPRERKPITAFAFGGKFGTTSPAIE